MGNITNTLFNAHNLKTLAVLGMLAMTFGRGAGKAHAVTYDPVTGWSSSTNTLASGVWSYGRAFSFSPTVFTLMPNYVANPAGSNGLDSWETSGYITSIIHNMTASTINYGATTYPVNELVLSPGKFWTYSILRFTAPAAGTYQITGQFIARSDSTTQLSGPTPGTNSDVAIWDNSGASLFSGNVIGPNGTSAQPFNLTQTLNANDNMDFRVSLPSGGVYGYGINGTGLQLSISSTTAPEPTTLALLALGGLGVLGKRLRRREG